MRSRLLGSWLIGLLALSWASLLLGAGALALNERFIDQASTGYLVFLFLPILFSVPLALLGLALGPFARSGGAREGGRFFALLTAILVAPPLAGLLSAASARLFLGSGAVIVLLAAAGAILLFAGAFRGGLALARLLLRDGTPRKAALAAPLLLLAALPLVGAGLSHRPIDFGDEPRILVLGVDAATWRIIDPLLAEGKLPTFRSLLAEGTRFDLESIPPLMSPILWTTIGSGVPATEHGIQSFYGSAADVTAPRLWDIAEEKGWSVGVLGWPVTWPPRPVPGFLIPSLFARGPETYPPEFQFIRELAMLEKGEAKRRLGPYAEFSVRMIQNGVKLSTFRQAFGVLSGRLDFTEKTVALRALKLSIHGDLFVELWERYRPRFASFYDNIVDVTSHYGWKYFEPDLFADVTPEEAKKYGRLIPDAYVAADRALGRILRYAPPGLEVVVVSDHGQEATKTEASGAVRLIHTESFLEVLGLEESVEGVNLASMVHLRAKKGCVLPEGLDAFVGDVVVERTGEPVFDAWIDEFGNFIVSVRPEPAIVGERLLIPGGKSCPAEEIVEETYAKISGEHSPDAILLLRGPHIRRGAEGGHADLYDVAPTTLYMMGLPAGDRMIGRVLDSAFEEGYVSSHPPAREAYAAAAKIPEEGTTADDTMLKEQLRALGYLQ
jgi:hypothetical protein